MIHDAARPFISQRIIDDCKVAIEENKCFLVAKPSNDSVYTKIPFKSINRDNIVMAQTPQGGPKSVLLNAHVNAINDNFSSTDDVSLLMKYSNEEIKIIDGEDANFKITTQLDYILAKEMVKL
jgi:2-C-methyl-D-erythritol 4-phosphate cytidylyltransferase